MPTAKQIFKRFDSLPEQEQTAFLLELVDRKPVKFVNLVELFEYTDDFRKSRYDAILNFADRFRKAHPKIYDKEYAFLELKLTEHAFYTMDRDLIDRCLGVISRNPAKGIDIITIVTLYRLIFHGMYEEALAYSLKVWEPVANDEMLMGYPELPFAMTIFMDGLEKQYERLCQGDAAGWNDFIERMAGYGFNNDKKRVDILYAALTSDLNPDMLIKSVRTKPEYGFIALTYHYLRFMKHKYQMPFMHACLFMELLQDKEILTYSKNQGAFLYLPLKVLDKHIAKKLDNLTDSNHLEIFGKVWGIHYVYEFLFENQMIDQKHYDKMLVTLATLKNQFLAVFGVKAWHARFLLSWPASKADTLTPDPVWFDKTIAGREETIGGFVKKIAGKYAPQDDNEPYADNKIPVEADDDLGEFDAEWVRKEGWAEDDDDEYWGEDDDERDDEDEEDDEDWDDDDEDEEDDEDWDDDDEDDDDEYWGEDDDEWDDEGWDDEDEEDDEDEDEKPEKNLGTLISGNDPYIAGKKTGRNEPCPCGSGKKYKKCCQQKK